MSTPSPLERLLRAAKVPGLQYLVVGPTRTVAEFNIGVADLATGLPMTAGTTMMAYSMSKTITAAAVLRLVDEGRAGLDDPILDHRVAHPYGPGVTVRRLLSHTAGVPSPIPLRWVHSVAAHAAFDEGAALAAVLDRHPRVASRPGTRYRYSNIGYWLLGPLVERASGTGFVEYVTKTVLRPLCLASDLDFVLPDASPVATGYLERYSVMNLFKSLLIDRALAGPATGRWVEIRRHYVNGPAFGGLVGTARGFARFLQDQLAPASTILGPEGRALYYQQQTTTDGAAVPMTPGWHTRIASGLPCFFKEGGGGGFHCMMRLYPSASIGTVLMTNATGFNVGRLMDQADALALAG